MRKNFLSVDVEDWHHSAFLRSYVNENNIEWRIDVTVNLILELFNNLQVHATFFVLGEVAVNFPSIITKIHEQGHEVASHGFSHTPLWDLNKKSFRDEIYKTNDILSTLTNKKVIGFRAPYASLNQSTAWSLDILQEMGFLYDSSIFPMKTPLYGVSNAPLGIYRINSNNILINDNASGLIEIPFSISKNPLFSIPVTGGIYGRFLPYSLLLLMLKRLSKKRRINFYFHPWEIDVSQPKIKTSMKDQIISYYNTDCYMKKIESLIRNFQFDSFENNLTDIKNC